MVRITAKGARDAQEFYEALINVSVGVVWATGGVHR
jgi:hypothetical protein